MSVLPKQALSYLFSFLTVVVSPFWWFFGWENRDGHGHAPRCS